MTNLLRTFYLLISSSFAAFILISSCYAETKTVILNCAYGGGRPFVHNEPGIPGTTIVKVEVEGMKIDGMQIGGKDVIITKQRTEPGHTAYIAPIFRSYVPAPKGREEGKALLGKLAVSTDIHGRCSSYSEDKLFTMWGPGESGTIPRRVMSSCPKGDGVVLELWTPDCARGSDQHAIVTITKVRDSGAAQNNTDIDFDALSLGSGMPIPTDHHIAVPSIFVGGAGYVVGGGSY